MKKQELSIMAEEVEELQKAVEEEVSLVKNAAYEFTDHTELASKYLSDASKKALSERYSELIIKYNKKIADDGNGNYTYVRDVATAQFFACQVRMDKLEEGIGAISDVINQLSEMDAIYSSLAPMSSMHLVQMPFKHDACVVFCFVHIKSEFEKIAKNMRFNTPEGGIGPELHSLDIELPEGEFFAECHVTHALTMMASKSNESVVFDIVNEYLKYLPEGTEFVGYRQTTIIGLYLPYELKFRNKYLPDVKRVELDHFRMVSSDGPDKIKQFNLFLGIRYFGVLPYSEDKSIVELYKRN